jgi:sortase A
MRADRPVSCIPSALTGRVAPVGSKVEMRFTRWFEYGAWALGLSLVLVYGVGRSWSEAARVQGLEALRHAAAANAVSPPGPDAAPVFRAEPGSVDQSLWSRQRMRAFAASITSPGVPDGALRIPSLQLQVPIYAGTTELNLNRGAAHIEGTAPLGPQGNIGIAAHRDGFFRKLQGIGMDADVYVEVGNRSLRYRVVDIGIVMPSDVHVLAPTEVASITLLTCYPFYFLGDAPQRYIVRAELVDSAAGASPADKDLSGTSIRTSTPKTIQKGASL